MMVKINIPFLRSEKGKKAETETPAQTQEAAPALSQSDLLAALDSASQALVASDLPPATTERYTILLNELKTEVSGLASAQPMPELYTSLHKAINQAIPKVGRFGTTEQIQQAEETLHKGVKALNDKEIRQQQIAIIDLQILVLRSEVYEAQHWITVRTQEVTDMTTKAIAEGRLSDLTSPVLTSIGGEVQSLNERNSTAEATIANLMNTRRALESNAANETFRKAYADLEEVIKKLPTTADIIKAYGEIKDIGRIQKGKLEGDATAINQATGGKATEWVQGIQQGVQTQQTTQTTQTETTTETTMETMTMDMEDNV